MYHLELGIVRYEMLNGLQVEFPGLNVAGLITDEDVVTFASTGEEATTGSTTRVFGPPTTPEGSPEPATPDERTIPIDYYNIKSLVMTNITGPQPQNPIVATILDAKIKLFEPFGFKLHETIKEIALATGYTNLHAGRIVYRLKIWWSGYDTNTGEWVRKIPYKTVGDKSYDEINIFLTVAQAEAVVTPSGTEYDLSMVPMMSAAHRPEDFIFDFSTNLRSEDSTFGGFLDAFALELDIQKEQRTVGQIKRTYRFFAPRVLREATFDLSKFRDEQQQGRQRAQQGQGGGQTVAMAHNQDILTVLKNALDDVELTQDLTLYQIQNDDFLQPVVRWNVRFNVIYGDREPAFDEFKTMEIHYIIEPFISFRRKDVTVENREAMFSREAQRLRIETMVDYGMIKRIYNYYFTEGNTDVIDFTFKFNHFYFNALNTNFDSIPRQLQQTPSPPSQAPIQRQTPPTRTSVTLQVTRSQADEDQIRRIFGQRRPDTGQRPDSPLAWWMGGMSEHPDQRQSGSITSEGQAKKNRYMQASELYLRNDLLRAQLTVRGDPNWIASNPYTSEGDTGLRMVGEEDTPIRPLTDHIILLRAFSPTQADSMSPTRLYGSTDQTLIGGFYGVLTITSTFEGGKFTQMLDLYKSDHLVYADIAIKGSDEE